ncbi:MAG TPA: hypothetical protein VFA63_07355 [Pseudonocardiaceae bacterium]|nr:hypothetical protein [Pseudonocardiaceae bacterium]
MPVGSRVHLLGVFIAQAISHRGYRSEPPITYWSTRRQRPGDQQSPRRRHSLLADGTVSSLTARLTMAGLDLERLGGSPGRGDG